MLPLWRRGRLARKWLHSAASALPPPLCACCFALEALRPGLKEPAFQTIVAPPAGRALRSPMLVKRPASLAQGGCLLLVARAGIVKFSPPFPVHGSYRWVMGASSSRSPPLGLAQSTSVLLSRAHNGPVLRAAALTLQLERAQARPVKRPSCHRSHVGAHLSGHSASSLGEGGGLQLLGASPPFSCHRPPVGAHMSGPAAHLAKGGGAPTSRARPPFLTPPIPCRGAFERAFCQLASQLTWRKEGGLRLL